MQPNHLSGWTELQQRWRLGASWVYSASRAAIVSSRAPDLGETRGTFRISKLVLDVNHAAMRIISKPIVRVSMSVPVIQRYILSIMYLAIFSVHSKRLWFSLLRTTQHQFLFRIHPKKLLSIHDGLRLRACLPLRTFRYARRLQTRFRRKCQSSLRLQLQTLLRRNGLDEFAQRT